MLYKGKSIADVLKMRIGEALELFGNLPKIRRILQTLSDVGLDYLALGQAAPTLSGGEAQRVKLAAELSRPNTGKTLYLLDEPTTGLHFDDIRKLLEVLQRLVDLGNTVLVVEHNLDVLKSADWLIDIGPDAGDAGGTVIAEGTPEDVVASGNSLYTGPFLAPVLTAGPRVHRPKYDPHAAEKKLAAVKELVEDEKMPWEVDGPLWHTEQRCTGEGEPCRWEGQVLAWVEKRIQEAGDFRPTNWKHPTTVEIMGKDKSLGWFFHAHTGMEWLVRLVFNVGKNTFKQEDLDRQLAIPTLNQTKGIEIYGNDARVKVANRKGPWQQVWMTVHRLSEIDTPAFRDFLAKAVASYQGSLKRMATKPEDLMPWKVMGQKWHLGPKGFPPGKKLQWDTGILPRLIDLVREVEPTIEVAWDSRMTVAFRCADMTRAWAQWVTKSPTGLTCRFLGKKGQFNLTQIEKFGVGATLTPHKQGEMMTLVFRDDHRIHAASLRELLKSHLAGFRETFAKS